MAAAAAGVNPGDRELKGLTRGDDVAALKKLREQENVWLKEIAAVEKPVRERLLKEADKSEQKNTPPQPTAAWNFTDDLADARTNSPSL